ncbi:hypothetical protein GGF31_005814 [Allomyces arbusculus]|nr:hypothetical protein GGF31_005814 [Allomyces arbusculus]
MTKKSRPTQRGQLPASFKSASPLRPSTSVAAAPAAVVPTTTMAVDPPANGFMQGPTALRRNLPALFQVVSPLRTSTATDSVVEAPAIGPATIAAADPPANVSSTNGRKRDALAADRTTDDALLDPPASKRRRPDRSVPFREYYKHISGDLPPSKRLATLLAWTGAAALRAKPKKRPKVPDAATRNVIDLDAEDDVGDDEHESPHDPSVPGSDAGSLDKDAQLDEATLQAVVKHAALTTISAIWDGKLQLSAVHLGSDATDQWNAPKLPNPVNIRNQNRLRDLNTQMEKNKRELVQWEALVKTRKEEHAAATEELARQRLLPNPPFDPLLAMTPEERQLLEPPPSVDVSAYDELQQLMELWDLAKTKAQRVESLTEVAKRRVAAREQETAAAVDEFFGETTPNMAIPVLEALCSGKTT